MITNLSPESLSESSIVTASAGSGKTHALTTRLIELLLNNVKSQNIIAQTFTRKAAGEIYGRLIVRLLDLCSEEPKDPSIKVKLPDGYALKVLRSLVLKQDRLRVETIDSFFADLCKSYFIELGLPPKWEIADEKQTDEIKIEALKSSISKVGLETFRTLMDFLLSNQVPNKILKPLIAETKDFISLLSSSPREAWGNLKIPETEFSLAEVKGQLELLLEESENIKFHKGVWNSIRSIVGAVENKDFSYLTKSEFLQKISKGDYTYSKKEIPEEILSPLINLVEVLKTEVLNNTNSRTLSLLGILTAYQVEYTSRIKEQGKLSFSDIAELISQKVDDLESSDLFSRLGMSLEHILLDEFQDTSPLQWRIIENLSRHILESSSAENSILIVGDAKQAIYGWRGGSAEVFNHLRKIAPHIKEETLSTNYRSNPGIVEFVNTIFTSLKDNEALSAFAGPINSWLEEFHPHIANRKSKEHIVSVAAYPEFEEDNQKYQIVIEDIAGVQSSDPEASIAVLFRRNSDIDKFGSLLRLQGMEFTSSTTSKLGSSYPVQLLISLVTLASHPEDKLSYVHLKNFGLDFKSFLGIEVEEAKNISLQLRKLFLVEGFSITLSRFSSIYLQTCSSELDRNILSLAISLAMEFERKGLTTWSEWIDRVSSTNIPSSNQSRLQLLSMHKAKGLEFDYVFIPSIEDPIWKSNFLKILKNEDDPFSPPKTIIRKPTESEISFVPELRALRESWINSQVREALSLLYVSLTRAVKGNFVYLNPTDKNINEINIPSLSDILRAALFFPEGVQPEESLYQSFKREFIEKLPEEEDATFRELESLDWSSKRKDTSHRLKGLKLQKVKKLSSDDNNEAGNVEDLLNKIKQSEALSFGTIIHNCLENLVWLDEDTNIPATINALISGFPILRNNTRLREEVKNYLLRIFDFENVKSLFLRSRYMQNSLEPRLLRETNLHLENDLVNLSGTIDRLVLCERAGEVKEIHIYDFKTDSQIDPEKHLAQMTHYKELISSHWANNPEVLVRCELIYLHSGEIVKV